MDGEYDPTTLNELVNVELDDSNLNDESAYDHERERVCDTEQSAHAMQYNMDCSMVTTESDINRWTALSQNLTGTGMI